MGVVGNWVPPPVPGWSNSPVWGGVVAPAGLASGSATATTTAIAAIDGMTHLPMRRPIITFTIPLAPLIGKPCCSTAGAEPNARLTG